MQWLNKNAVASLNRWPAMSCKRRATALIRQLSRRRRSCRRNRHEDRLEPLFDVRPGHDGTLSLAWCRTSWDGVDGTAAAGGPQRAIKSAQYPVPASRAGKSDALDLDARAEGKRGDGDGRARRRVGREERAPDLVHRREVVDRGEEHGALDYPVERGTGAREVLLHIGQRLAGLGSDAALDQARLTPDVADRAGELEHVTHAHHGRERQVRRQVGRLEDLLFGGESRWRGERDQDGH